MASKRIASGEPNDNVALQKQLRSERPEEFSNAVKKKLQLSNRTGQACDRCKIRKIRCDRLQGGCSPCLQNHLKCQTTDRITGRATSRGYVEKLELENRSLCQRVKELESLLSRDGADVKPSDGFHDATSPTLEYSQSPNAQPPSWGPSTPFPPPPSVDSKDQQPGMDSRSMPSFRTGWTNGNFLGVSSRESPLSPIKGTALSILGMEIDIADFKSVDLDEPPPGQFNPQLFNKSYQSFLQSALNINHRQVKAALPPQDEALRHAHVYFRLINPYIPLLHKPTFMKLLTRSYDDPGFTPTTAETVLVHMVFAVMYFQTAARNWNDPVEQDRNHALSNEHYHYSLSLFFSLVSSRTVQDVQALTMICSHLRNFPKPGPSWILTQMTLSLSLELGLHRSTKRWSPKSATNPLDIEMRKRIFWTLLTINVTLSGKLGRPMTLNAEDFDVEIPMEVDDDLLSDQGIDESRPGRCQHKIGLWAFRLVPLFMEMFNTIYAVRRQPDNYIATVTSLESKVQAWSESLPKVLSEEPEDLEGRIFALYAVVWTLEFRLLLRHPSVSMTNDQQFNAESLRICGEISRKMLCVVRQLQSFNCLDTTWYNSAVYVMAITTTLFVEWEKRSEITTSNLAALREEMDSWLKIMRECGHLLGSGERLRDAVKVVTEGTLCQLARSMTARRRTPEVPRSAEPQQVARVPGNDYASNATYNFSNSPATNVNNVEAAYASNDGVPHQETPYPPSTQYNFQPEVQANTTPIPFTHHTNQPYAPYPRANGPPLQEQSYSNHPSQVSQHGWHRRGSHAQFANSHAWQSFASQMAGSLVPDEAYSLMELGASQTGPDMQQGMIVTPSAGINHGPPGGGQSSMQMPWPQNMLQGHDGP
ncbi:fungal-specific transcription factor domain-containing protein [Amylocarpus encephaloides]|uniref:Fungal-specific transcription factor domain-containing protein n=1 Tax=Amylocarpus encephaloides TaxID=45428 RepID=A0A9P7YHD1_9HELO|nr:fungal-specific transcription factor domain-containing protein [Amylocarpus encephaloides]